MMFFFQAEDGIRDLVRSRGLGDVYKRQDYDYGLGLLFYERMHICDWKDFGPTCARIVDAVPVSYTHLTLPTSDLV